MSVAPLQQTFYREYHVFQIVLLPNLQYAEMVANTIQYVFHCVSSIELVVFFLTGCISISKFANLHPGFHVIYPVPSSLSWSDSRPQRKTCCSEKNRWSMSVVLNLPSVDLWWLQRWSGGTASYNLLLHDIDNIIQETFQCRVK